MALAIHKLVKEAVHYRGLKQSTLSPNTNWLWLMLMCCQGVLGAH